MPIPMPIRNWPTNIHSGASAAALISGADGDDRHVDQEGRLAAEAVGRRAADRGAERGAEHQRRADQSDHERAERETGA